MTDLISRSNGQNYPNTRLGELIYFGVYHELKRRGVDPEGLRLGSAMRSRADIHHYTDGYLYLRGKLVTIDLYNLDSEVCRILKDRWDEASESDFQTHLFLYKKGMAEVWKKGGNKVVCWDHLFNPPEFYSSGSRPVNHFVLTPYYLENQENRRRFVNMIVDYLTSMA